VHIYRLERAQKLPVSQSVAWSFFSNPANLAQITPDWLNFEILEDISDIKGAMYEGMIIHYRIKAMPFVTMKWVTEITHVREPEYFVDVQRVGPYSFWHHQHHFRAVCDGIEMRDILHYRLPLGLLGRMVQGCFVGRRLEAIFDYRRTYLETLFG
jgi:ligand-binding SRPBCC domain-containing protein